MDKIKISQMTMEDLEGVYEIDKEAFPIPWRRSSFEEELKNVLATYLVAKIDENIVGYLGMWFIMDECHITNIAVSSNYRRMGIAKELLHRIVEEAREYGCGTIQITASDMGVKLYESYGFVHNGNFMQYKL